MREGGGRQRADVDDLQQQVDGGADGHRAEHGPGDVLLRVGALTRQLDGLLEAEQGEDDAAGADRGQDALRAERGEAATGGEVAAVEVGERQDEDRQQRNEDLPPGRRTVCMRQDSDAEEVDGDEHRHQAHGHGYTAAGQYALRVLKTRRPGPVTGVPDHGLDLDRGDRSGLEPGEPTERHPGETAEGVVRVPGGAARHREHSAELGVDQRQQDDRDRADHPGDDRGGAGHHERVLRAVQPAGADDRTNGSPGQTDDSDLAPKVAIGCAGWGQLVCGSHGEVDLSNVGTTGG